MAALFEEMGSKGVERNTMTYNATISACEKGGQLQRAVELFEEMGRQGVDWDTITYNATISACEKGGQFDRCVTLYGDACLLGFLYHSLPSHKGGIDLHGLCTSVAKAAIVLLLSRSDSGTGRLGGHLAFVAGRGNHVLADGRRGVLRAEMELFLTEQLGLPVQTVHVNDGMLIVRAVNVAPFLQAGRPGDSTR